jgi:hypothetical protein
MAVVQYTYTHKQYRKRHKTKNTKNTKIHRATQKMGECGPCPLFAGFTLAFALKLRKKHGETSVRVVTRC